MFDATLELSFFNNDKTKRFTSSERVFEDLNSENVKKYFLDAINMVIPNTKLKIENLAVTQSSVDSSIRGLYYFDTSLEFRLIASKINRNPDLRSI